jgi:hypothetical protein
MHTTEIKRGCEKRVGRRFPIRPGRSGKHEPARTGSSLARDLGNQAVGEAVQTKLAVGPVDDPHERQADRMAEQVMRMPAQSVSDRRLPLSPGAVMSSTTRAGRPELPFREGHSRPLAPDMRIPMERHFGEDFSDVRVHTGSEAQRAAAQINARAFTHGRDIWLGKNASPGDRRLMAHEMTHVVQQSRGLPGRESRNAPPLVQRDENEEGGEPPQEPAPAQIGANEIIPFAVGSQVVLGNILRDVFMGIVRQQQPETASTLEAIDRQVAEVIAAGPDRFEAVVQGTVTVPGAENQESRTLEDVRVVLARQDDGAFTFSITGRQQGEDERVALQERRGLVARRAEGGIVLSTFGGTPQLRVQSPSEGTIRLGVFGAAIEGVPELMHEQVFEAIELNRLEPAETDREVEEQIEEIAERQSSARRERRQEISVGTGIGLPSGRDPLWMLRAGWRMRFPTTGLLPVFGVGEETAATAGQFVQVPLEVQLMYAPESSFIGTIGTGAELNIPTRVPLNVRLILAGIGGGSLQPPEGTARSTTLGLPFGVSVGTELGIFRVHVRYDALINLMPGGTTIQSVTGGAGLAF